MGDEETQTIPLWLHQFQVQLTGTLGRLEEGQKGINTRLDKINGSVADHTKRLCEIELRNASRVFGCPLINDIKKLTDQLHNQLTELQDGAMQDRAVDAALQAQEERWYKRLSPYVQWTVVAIVVLLISHFSEIMKTIKGG